MLLEGSATDYNQPMRGGGSCTMPAEAVFRRSAHTRSTTRGERPYEPYLQRGADQAHARR
eukprot:6173284-Pleurochrysis_carterae.AAC.3